MPSLRVPQVRRVPPPSLWTTAECSHPQDSTDSTDTAPDLKTYTHTRRNRGEGREKGVGGEGRGRGNRAKWKGGGQHTYVVLKRHLSFIHITQWELIIVTN